MPPDVGRIIERMGLRFEADGLPRIAGRLLAYTLLCPEPRSLDDLAEELQISKSSASTDARLLERVGALERVTLPGDRRDYYRLKQEFPRGFLDNWMSRMRELRDLLREGLESPAAEDGRVEARLRRAESFMDHLLKVVTEARASWREDEFESRDLEWERAR